MIRLFYACCVAVKKSEKPSTLDIRIKYGQVQTSSTETKR